MLGQFSLIPLSMMLLVAAAIMAVAGVACTSDGSRAQKLVLDIVILSVFSAFGMMFAESI